MKPKKTLKKLNLRKVTISGLNSYGMNVVKGGSSSDIHECFGCDTGGGGTVTCNTYCETCYNSCNGTCTCSADTCIVCIPVNLTLSTDAYNQCIEPICN